MLSIAGSKTSGSTTLSAITGIGSQPASIFQTRSTSSAAANTASLDETGNNSTSSASNNAAVGRAAAATNPLAPNVLSQILNAQADASSPGGVDVTANLVAVNTADLPHINLLTNLTENDGQFITAATGLV
ncbi:MAG TPA: hypothetical protein VKT76_16040, partial [Bradyrhizobium sp.]|nr:hypothetical protein [Bradyrhizobium sp.]